MKRLLVALLLLMGSSLVGCGMGSSMAESAVLEPAGTVESELSGSVCGFSCPSGQVLSYYTCKSGTACPGAPCASTANAVFCSDPPSATPGASYRVSECGTTCTYGMIESFTRVTNCTATGAQTNPVTYNLQSSCFIPAANHANIVFCGDTCPASHSVGTPTYRKFCNQECTLNNNCPETGTNNAVICNAN